jgi:hypothetical protein
MFSQSNYVAPGIGLYMGARNDNDVTVTVTEHITHPFRVKKLKVDLIDTPVRLSNGMSFGDNTCNHCDSTVTIGLLNQSLCFNCINDVVIYHQARQSWIENNGDPINELKKEIAELKQELLNLKDLRSGNPE